MLIRLATLGLLPLANAFLSYDLVMKGNYTAVNCGDNTNLVHDLLANLTTSYLPPVIADAKSLNPSPAYKTFFKDASSAPFVASLLTNVTTGVPMTAPSHYSMRGGVSFFCVNAPGQFVFDFDGAQDAYNNCLAAPRTPTMYIGFVSPQPYVVVCPSFFTSNIPAVPPGPQCMSVSRYINRFRGSGQGLWLYQIWILLSMITHYYLFTSTGNTDPPSDIKDVNKCFRLSAEQSRLNAYNYVYYAANIYGQCRVFPSPSDRGREILEVDVVPTPWDDNAGSDRSNATNQTVLATDLLIGGENPAVTP